MKCPVCKEVQLVMTERQGVEIDYCPQCRGVWLDRGELDKIIERSTREGTPYPNHPEPRPTPMHPPQQHHHGHHEYNYKHKRRKSFLDDLFDFD